MKDSQTDDDMMMDEFLYRSRSVLCASLSIGLSVLSVMACGAGALYYRPQACATFVVISQDRSGPGFFVAASGPRPRDDGDVAVARDPSRLAEFDAATNDWRDVAARMGAMYDGLCSGFRRPPVVGFEWVIHPGRGEAAEATLLWEDALRGRETRTLDFGEAVAAASGAAAPDAPAAADPAVDRRRLSWWYARGAARRRRRPLPGAPFDLASALAEADALRRRNRANGELDPSWRDGDPISNPNPQEDMAEAAVRVSTLARRPHLRGGWAATPLPEAPGLDSP